MTPRTRQGNPKLWLTAFIATSIAAASYKLYINYIKPNHTIELIDQDESMSHEDSTTVSTATTATKHSHTGGSQPHKKLKVTSNNKNYTSKSIALTLSHTVLSSSLPLDEILSNSENVTFILPPNLSMDDLEGNIKTIPKGDESESTISLPRTLLKNYKLLNCSNIQGYFALIKNLKPDMLLVCADDLGIESDIPKDLKRFVKEIVTIDQNREDIYSTISQIFIR